MGEVGNRDARHLKFSLKTFAMTSLSFFLCLRKLCLDSLRPSQPYILPLSPSNLQQGTASPGLGYFFFFLTVSDSYYQFHQL